MRIIVSFLKLFLSVLIFAAAVYYGGNVVFNICGHSIEVHLAALVFAILLLFYIYGWIKSLFYGICSFFAGRPSHEKGLEHLQMAFSGILLKDFRLTEKSLKKARQYLGDIPLLSWIEGQLMLATNDQYRAKAIFYDLSEKERDTALGAYSICNMAIKEHSTSDAINAINAILKVYPRAYELAFQAIAILLRNRSFSEAKKYISVIDDTKKSDLVEAIIYSEEGISTENTDLLKKAFKLSPQLSKNASKYAEMLVRDDEFRTARKVLIKAFSENHLPELYDQYITCAKEVSDSDQLKLAEKMTDEVPDSWVAYYRFAELALKNDMKQLAFQNFLKAYELEPYDFIAEKLQNTAAIIGKTDELPKPLLSKSVRFLWRCHHCGNESKTWMPVCDHCDWVGEYRYEEQQQTEPFGASAENGEGASSAYPLVDYIKS